MALYGKYRGIVKDTADPDKRGRVRVECKEVYGTAMSPWALPCFKPNEFRVPAIGDIVWIEFEAGVKSKPIWVGCVYTKEQVANKFLVPYDPVRVVDLALKDRKVITVGLQENITFANLNIVSGGQGAIMTKSNLKINDTVDTGSIIRGTMSQETPIVGTIADYTGLIKF